MDYLQPVNIAYELLNKDFELGPIPKTVELDLGMLPD